MSVSGVRVHRSRGVNDNDLSGFQRGVLGSHSGSRSFPLSLVATAVLNTSRSVGAFGITAVTPTMPISRSMFSEQAPSMRVGHPRQSALPNIGRRIISSCHAAMVSDRLLRFVVRPQLRADAVHTCTDIEHHPVR